MTIENRTLKAGMRLEGTYHKDVYRCTVHEKEGKLVYRLEDEREFTSLSAAGSAITGHACNGWVFWTVTDERAPVAGPAAKPAAKAEAKPAPEPATKKVIKKVPNQKGVPEGQVRWHCYDCGKSFLADSGTSPDTCPLC